MEKSIPDKRPVPATEAPLFKTLVECSADFIALLDRDGVVTFVSPAITTVAGYQPAELLGKKLLDFIHPEDQAAAQRGLLAASPAMNRATYRYRHQAGTWLHIDTLSKYAIDDAEVGAIVVNTRDVTAQRRAEESLRNVSRALNALSAVSTALIEAADETELLGQVCRIMVESAGYRMAWVGFAEPDNHKSVRPVAQYGYESGYLAGANITWDESERGRGPTGEAIRTGTSRVNQNTLTNPRMQPWWQDALKRGYKSSAAIPLRLGQGVFGALTVYAPESDAFNAEELRLLEQLAAELGYGMMALRARAAAGRDTVAPRAGQ